MSWMRFPSPGFSFSTKFFIDLTPDITQTEHTYPSKIQQHFNILFTHLTNMVHIVREMFWRLHEVFQFTSKTTPQSGVCVEAGNQRNPAFKSKPRCLSRTSCHNNSFCTSVKRKIQCFRRPKTAAVLEVIPYDPIDEIVSMYSNMPESDPNAMIIHREDQAHRHYLDMLMRNEMMETRMMRSMQPTRSCFKNPMRRCGKHPHMQKKHVHFDEVVRIEFI
ncbi:hypothetical protein COEREDRAFT_87419 [Coemansia reversa NRRL 1564]|uniref:Uncharacterized protein n=1 Tax=Coemansia reversa (strain ATCC 12441 / NRRL 1564) TaxID=763665 RepID=A0A2G5BA89_COERN|nr:hypothetical protein COEREDRAFT_87419 [Coemansia reversa NRRL 1564]|eukprot:PIA15924.1 hypothetical protein COEREDRAFT_87419 [Coemansia reversa NRRL 1564]